MYISDERSVFVRYTLRYSFNVSYAFNWNGNQLPEQINQPLGVQDDCVLVLHNYSQVVVKIHHDIELVGISYEALFPSNDSHLFNVQITNILLCQSIDDPLKVQPPRSYKT